MKSEDELLEYIGERVKALRSKSDLAKSRLEKEKTSAIIQEYKELLEFYKEK